MDTVKAFKLMVSPIFEAMPFSIVCADDDGGNSKNYTTSFFAKRQTQGIVSLYFFKVCDYKRAENSSHQDRQCLLLIRLTVTAGIDSVNGSCVSPPNAWNKVG